MATKTFDDLPETERMDFLNIYAQAAIAPDEFNVSFTQEIAGDCGVTTCGRLIIVQLFTIMRAYEDAEDIPWTVQFNEDIKAKISIKLLSAHASGPALMS